MFVGSWDEINTAPMKEIISSNKSNVKRYQIQSVEVRKKTKQKGNLW